MKVVDVAPFDSQEAVRINEARISFLGKFLPELIETKNIRTVLDVGCGYGIFSSYLKSFGLKVTAFDGRPENIAEAKKRYPDIEFRVSDIEHPACLDMGSYDLVFCFGLLYHLENPFRAIRNLFTLTNKCLLIETMVAPYRSLVAGLYEEAQVANQGLRYAALIPSESTFAGMLYKVGFPCIYKANEIPQHEQFQKSLVRHKNRTVFLAEKEPLAREIELGRLRFSMIPEPKVPLSSPQKWDNSIGKLMQPLTSPKFFGLHLFDLSSRYMPPSWIIKACELMVKPRQLRPWHGWTLGSGESQTYMPTLFRLLLWRAFSSRCLTDTFTLKWHKEIKVLAYPKVESCRSLFVTGYYEPNEFYFLNGTLKPGMVFIDVGANLGLYALFASKLVGEDGCVVAIEPSEREFQRMKANIELNRSTNVRPIQAAVSDTVSEKELMIAEERHSGHNTFGAFAYEGVQSQGKQRVDAMALDDLVSKEGLSRVDVIKMDIEGHELFVLRGARKTLTKFRPLLLVEIADRALVHQGCTSEQVLVFLRHLGYRIYLFSRQTGLPVVLDEKIERSYSENVLAIHESFDGKLNDNL